LLKYHIARAEHHREEMLCQATKYMNLVEQEDHQSPSTKDMLAEAHQMFSHVYLTAPLSTDGVAKAFEHSIEALKLYLDIGKIISVQGSLFDQGLMWGAIADAGEKHGWSIADNAVARAGAFLLTAEQIQIEIEIPEHGDWHGTKQRRIERFLSSYVFIEGGEQSLPEWLVPYYERALKRYMDPNRFRIYTELPQSAQHLLESITQLANAIDPESVWSNAIEQWLRMASRGEESEELKAAADEHLKNAAQQVLEGVENDESVRGQLANVTQDLLEMAQQWSAILEQDETLRHKLKEWLLGEVNELSSGTEPEDV
jgi:hypothetical protein